MAVRLWRCGGGTMVVWQCDCCGVVVGLLKDGVKKVIGS